MEHLVFPLGEKKKKKRKKSKLPAACIYLIVDMQTQHKEVGIYIGC